LSQLPANAVGAGLRAARRMCSARGALAASAAAVVSSALLQLATAQAS